MLQPKLKPRRARVATPRRSSRVARLVGEVVSLLLLSLCLLAAAVLIVVPVATGSQTYAVLTSSMAPNYPPGTFIVVKPQDFATLQVGDVVTYQIESGKPGVITHRITGFGSDQAGNRVLVTKGDNNDATDPESVREIQVRGKLLYAVPHVGYLANALGQTNRGAIVNVLAVALIGYGLFTLSRGLLGATRRSKEQERAPE